MAVPGWLNPNHWLAANLSHALDGDKVVVRTSRYLRLGMVGLVLGLAWALIHELNRVQNLDHKWCLLGSISAYYYTPVSGFFVGTLVAIGISLFAIRGNTVAEDMLLNFAGVLAPFVALVPTPKAPTNCRPVLDTTNRDLNIANNASALFVVVGAAFVVLAGLWIGGFLMRWLVRGSGMPEPPPEGEPAETLVSVFQRRIGGFRSDRAGLIAYLVALAIYIAALVWFLADRTGFEKNAHPYSAIGMFAFLAINALVNGYNLYQQRQHQPPPTLDLPRKREVWRFNTYTAIGTFMALTGVVFLVIVRPHWDQWVFGLEAIEIGLFAAFWLVQTVELWDNGLRPKVPQAAVEALKAA